MKKITDFIVEKRNFILILTLILTAICFYTSTKVKINFDITRYLPSSSETKKGADIMHQEFPELKSGTLNAMFKNVTDKEELRHNLEQINGVSSVLYEDTEEYNQGKYTLYILNVDDYASSKTASDVYNTVHQEFHATATSGTIDEENKPVLQTWIIVLAISLAMVILIIMSDSYVEPFLYLFAIGLAIFINKGTNIFFSSVSNITDSITAVLQLALSMDYSIILSNRFRQERTKNKDKVEAMKKALYNSFKSITSSSITTIVGLLALVFMSFTIGKDLGFVLAKGVLLSLLTILLCLPALLLIFDNAITKTKKKSISFNLSKLGAFSYKTRYFQLVIVIIALIGSYLIKGNLGILYTASEQDEVGKIFPATNQMALVYKKEYENLIASYCKQLENNSNIEQVLCYGNTINEKLAYNELNQKFNDLGQDVEIEEYLIKLIYYNYYVPNSNNKMTLNEFIHFIKNDISSQEEFKNKIDQNTQDNLTLLENFTSMPLAKKNRTAKNISNLLDIPTKDVEKIIIYYNSKNNNLKLSLYDFVTFINKDVLTNKEYANRLDNNTKSSIEELTKFIDKKTITTQYSANQIAKLFGMDTESVEKIFMLYTLNQTPSNKMTLADFATFSLSLSKQENYKDLFTDKEELLENLVRFSDTNSINKQMPAKEMSEYLNVPTLNETKIQLLYQYYYANDYIENKDVLSLIEDLTKFIKENIPDDKQEELIKIIKLAIEQSGITTPKTEEEMKSSLLTKIGITQEQISEVYKISGKETLTEVEFLQILLKEIPLPEEQIKEKAEIFLEIIKSNEIPTLEEIEKIINNSPLKDIYQKYKENINSKTMTPYTFITFLNDKKDDKILKTFLTKEDKQNILLALNIMNNTDKYYSYIEINNYLNSLNPSSLTEEEAKQIYNIYNYYQKPITMRPDSFVNFILKNQHNPLLANKLNSETIKKLNLLSNVMKSVLNNQKYTKNQMASFLGTKKENVELIYGLYSTKFSKNANQISLYNLLTILEDDLLFNPAYKNMFSNSQAERIHTIVGIMRASEKQYRYNSKEVYSILSRLNDNLDENLIDLTFIYYGSTEEFDSNWKLSVEEFIEYVNSDILTDVRYQDFISSSMATESKDALKMIHEAKKMLVSTKYNRAILNTKYAFENKETFEFIQNMQDTFDDKEGIYIAGDSPMALEISKTFGKELDFITILTIIFIFVVVAITFKSLLLPLILVLIIQTAVYITMSILALLGGNVYFIALLIVQAILMGATIDYAIVYTSYYKEARTTKSVQDSLTSAYNKSIHTILTSASILIIVTLVVANFASAIAAKICETLSQGTLCAAILILFALPGILACFDKLICKN